MESHLRHRYDGRCESKAAIFDSRRIDAGVASTNKGSVNKAIGDRDCRGRKETRPFFDFQCCTDVAIDKLLKFWGSKTFAAFTVQMFDVTLSGNHEFFINVNLTTLG